MHKPTSSRQNGQLNSKSIIHDACFVTLSFKIPLFCILIFYRFYEAVVCLPLQKAQALDPAGDAFNDQLDASIREHALAQRKQCYEIIANALRSLASPLASPTLDEASRSQYICQIVHLGVQSTDRAFREYLYKAMIELHLENELLEYGGPDLVPFLQNAGSHSESQVC